VDEVVTRFYIQIIGNNRSQPGQEAVWKGREKRSTKPNSLARTRGAYQNRTGV